MAANQPPNIPILTDVIAQAREPDQPISAADADALLDERGSEPAAAGGPPKDEAAGIAAARRDNEALIAELQTRLASATFALTEELMRAAFSEMEAKLYRQISARLRRELPELVDSLLREHLDVDRDV
jgi:hypothetical protein